MNELNTKRVEIEKSRLKEFDILGPLIFIYGKVGETGIRSWTLRQFFMVVIIT